MSERKKIFITLWKCGCLRVKPGLFLDCGAQDCEISTAEGKKYFVAGQELVPVAK